MVLPKPPNYNQPIPNSPFYSPQQETLSSGTGPLVVGTGLVVNYSTGYIGVAGGGAGVNIVGDPPIYVTGDSTNPTIHIETAQKWRLGVVQAGQNVDIDSSGVISVQYASTTARGVVQLVDGTYSISNQLALAAHQGYVLQQQINALQLEASLNLAGTFDPSTSQMVEVTSLGLTAGFVQGSNLPLPDPSNKDYYVIITTEATYTPPTSLQPVDTYPGSWFLSEGSKWNYIQIGIPPAPATEVSAGVIRLATEAEAKGGTEDTTAITPLKLCEAAILRSDVTDKGAILTGLAPEVVTALPPGPDGYVLEANSACPEGLKWAQVAGADAIPCACVQNVGSILVGCAVHTPTSLPVGLNCQFLRVNYNCPTSLEWVTVTNDFAIPCDVFTGPGQLITSTGVSSPVALPVGGEGQILTVCGSCTATGGLTWTDNTSGCYIPRSCLEGPTFAQRCPTGSLIATGSNGNIATIRGAADNPQYNGHALVSCSACTNGLVWAEASPPQSCFTGTAGEIYVGTNSLLSSGFYDLCALMPGTNGQILKIDDTQPQRVVWDSPWPATASEYVANKVCIDKQVGCVYTLLPTTNYPVGTWMVTMWGSACNASGSACMRLYFEGQGVQFIEYPNTLSEIPFSQTAFVCNDPTTGNACWHACNSSTGAGAQYIVFCAHMTAIRVG